MKNNYESTGDIAGVQSKKHQTKYVRWLEGMLVAKNLQLRAASSLYASPGFHPGHQRKGPVSSDAKYVKMNEQVNDQ